MTSNAYSSVNIQASAHQVPSTLYRFVEVTLIAHYLKRQGALAAIEEQGHCARRHCLSLRSDRFCRGAARLCHQRRTDTGCL
jgi:hypothetical protein